MMDILGDMDAVMRIGRWRCHVLHQAMRRGRTRPDEKGLTGRYNEYGMYGQADI